MNEPTPPHPPRYPKITPASAPMRKRMKRREGGNEVRFFTFSCQRRLPLLSDPLATADFLRALADARRARGFKLFAYVLMPEHVHLLVRPARDDTGDALLKSIKLTVAQRAINRWRRRKDDALLAQVDSASGPRFWQKGGGFDRNVRDMGEFTREVLYCHQNPVERGLVPSATDWKWSSVHQWLARHKGELCGTEPAIDMPPGRGRDWPRWRGFVVWAGEKTQ